MRKGFLLARANLRRAKGQGAAIVVLVFLAAMMLNLWLMLSMDYRQNFDRRHDSLNAEHVTLAVDGEDREIWEFVAETLEEEEGTDAFFLSDCMHMVGSFTYNGGETNSELIFLEKEAAVSRPIGRVEILEEGGGESGIYMPLLYKSEEIALGKTVEISVGSNKMSYTICGFFNSIMAGSHNCTMCELILTQDKYRELEESGYAPKATLCSIRLKNKGESENFEAMLKSKLSSQYPTARTVSNCYALVTQSRYISQMICAGVVSALDFFILLIVLVVISSNVVNYIQENMKNLGALKAVGYTSRQLMGSLLMQFVGLAFLAAVAGAGISYCLFPFVNEMMIAQTGIPYVVHFLPVPFLLTLAICGGAVALAVWFYSRRIRKMEPITALRQGIQTHSFRRNHIPLSETGAPLNLALALKTTFSGIKNNVTVCITMVVLSLVVVFSGLMIRNMVLDMTPFINLIVGETADSCINVNADTEEELLRELHADSRVEKVYLYNSVEICHVDGATLLATFSEDFSDVNNQNVVFDGRFPKYDNEIAIAAKYAGEKGLEIGDEIAITAEGKEAKYLITGFTQISNNLGKDCLLTREGYERLGVLQHASYYLNLAEEVDIEEFHREIKEKFGNEVNALINIRTTIEGSATVYVLLMTIIVVAILGLSAVIIVFVLYLLVRTTLNSKRRDYGILKALGFTTGQLIVQTALSLMPAVLISTVVGIFVNSLIINPLTALFLRGIGIVKCNFVVPISFNVIAGAGLVLFTFGTACLLSMKIRKITPRALFVGE
ncbi:MAG: FtsX-like permease family protein [Lachnospiraceae bacterium]|nr:FtsX-like permease family protein [Lachnospiraceae bacterium]